MTVSLFELTAQDRAVIAGERLYGPTFDSGYCTDCGRRGSVKSWRTVELYDAMGLSCVLRSWRFRCLACELGRAA